MQFQGNAPWLRRCAAALSALIFLFSVGSAQAAAPSKPRTCCTRSVWLGPSYHVRFGDGFPESSRHGAGINGAYEFHISPKFNIGLMLAYRIYPGERVTQQLGYGAVLKHFFSDRWATQAGVFPFLDYGLLLQQSFVEGLKGAGVSHDTRLGGGVVARIASVAFYVSLAGHYSRLSYFDAEPQWIPYLDTQIGWVHPF